MIDYIKKNKQVYLPYVANLFSVSVDEVVKCIIDNNIKGQLIQKLFVINPPEQHWYVETCDTKYNRGKYVVTPKQTFPNKKDQHHSVFWHDQKWAEHVSLTGKVNVKNTFVTCPYIYLELDRENLEKAMQDAVEIYYSFEHSYALQLWYSGNRSIHIACDTRIFGSPVDISTNVCGIGYLFYNLAHRIAKDVRHKNGLIDSWTASKDVVHTTHEALYPDAIVNLPTMRQQLENIDPNLFRLNSLIRTPYSFHEKTNLQKIPICPVDLIKGKLTHKKYPKVDINPVLMSWVYDCYTPVTQKKEIKTISNESFVINTFSKYIEDFDPSLANEDGWISGLSSPFYNDTNPSVSVNIQTGLYYDFGNPEHQFGIIDFMRLIDANGKI